MRQNLFLKFSMRGQVNMAAQSVWSRNDFMVYDLILCFAALQNLGGETWAATEVPWRADLGYTHTPHHPHGEESRQRVCGTSNGKGNSSSAEILLSGLSLPGLTIAAALWTGKLFTKRRTLHMTRARRALPCPQDIPTSSSSRSLRTFTTPITSCFSGCPLASVSAPSGPRRRGWGAQLSPPGCTHQELLESCTTHILYLHYTLYILQLSTGTVFISLYRNDISALIYTLILMRAGLFLTKDGLFTFRAKSDSALA